MPNLCTAVRCPPVTIFSGNLFGRLPRIFLLLGSLLLLLLAPSFLLARDDAVALSLFKHKALLLIGKEKRLLHVGEISPEGIKLLSADSYSAVIEVAGERRTLEVTDSNMIDPNRFAATEKMQVTIHPDNDGSYRINGIINKANVQFLVDTGASIVLMNKHAAKRVNIPYKKGTLVKATTASGVTPVYLVSLDRVRIGNIELVNVEGAVHDSDFPREVLLGNSFLSRVKITRGKKLMVLEK